MKTLSKIYNPKQVEDRIYRLWQKSGFFNPDKLPGLRKKPYSIVIPPPNITGSLHMGHALNAICQDVLIRWKRLQGSMTLWLPGIDHAGIATQNVVEKELKKEGKTRFDLGRKKFIKRIWTWKEKYENIILEQLKKFGCSLDWSRTCFTLDKEYSQAVNEAFLHYYKKGWIYLGKRPINWCPRCQTSLSDLEIEYKEEKGKLWYIKYPLPKGRGASYIEVATTRPETMLGDRAIAVNPKDKRYKNLVDKKVILPLINQEIPIIGDKWVDPKFGTGVVKVTPGHDLTDYEISLRHNLKIIQVIDKNGKMVHVPAPYQGLTTLEARKKVIENLKNQGLLEKIEDHVYQIPCCYRCETVLELIPSEQWFLKMKELSEMAEAPVKKGKIKFHPQSFEKGYFQRLKNIREWCISRQIWWGHQLPIWLCQTRRNWKPKTQDWKLKKKYFISLKKPKKCPICGKCQPEQISDVLDTWFSSALWPLATLGWPKKTKDLNRFYPADVLSTDRGIINLWVARMIFSGMELMKKIPFKQVYIHPTVLTREGKRMSKSLGTGINPLILCQRYGADATRFGIAWQIMGGQDIRFLEDNILMGRKFCNKLWNASRFVLLQITNHRLSIRNKLQIPNSKLTPADKRILMALKRTIKSVNRDLEHFYFGPATHKLYDFFWHHFCDVYIEKSKKQADLNTEKILLYVLSTCLKLLHPFLPFITEEIYQKLPIKNKKKFLMVEEWPKINK